MRKLHESITNVLLGKYINENHDEVTKKLNAAAGSHIGGETPAFVHSKGKNEDGPESHSSPKHSSPVTHHYYHQGQFGSGDVSHEHHITVSHHADNTATVQHSAGKQKWSERDEDYHVSEKHHEKHFSDLHSATEHIKKLHTPE